MKAALQGLVMVGVFAAMLIGLTNTPWNRLLKLDNRKQALENKLGDVVMKSIKREYKEVTDDRANAVLDSLLTALCEANDIKKADIHEHLMHSEQVNAFAMPGNHLVVLSGLVADAQNSGEVVGVLAHEVAHLQEKHIIKLLIQQLGIAFLTGNAGDKAAVIVNTLVNNGFSRQMEAEADKKAVQYMRKAGVDPKHLSDFFYRLHLEKGSDDELEWLSTHPLSEDRAKEVARLARKQPVRQDNIMSAEAFHAWKALLEQDRKDQN